MSIKRLGMYGGFFFVMLLVALCVTGVFHQGVLPRLSARLKGEVTSGREAEGAPKAPVPAAETQTPAAPPAELAKTAATEQATQVPVPVPTEPPKGAPADKGGQVKRLSRMYEGMRAKEAAAVLEKLERLMAAQVLAEINHRQAAKILGAMNPTVAAELTRLLGRIGEKETS